MSNEPKANMNLDPEMLAAYIDNRLTTEQRAEVESQLARDPDSYNILVETLKAEEALVEVPDVPIEVPGVPGMRKVRRWTIAAGVLAAAAALALVVRLQPDWSQGRLGDELLFKELAANAGTARSVESRFSHLPHQPLRVSRGGADSVSQNPALLSFVGRLQQDASSDSGSIRHVLGVGLVLAGRYDDAIRELQLAAEHAPDPTVSSDLSAAFLARASVTGDREDFTRALEAADRALSTSNRSAAALFNRALAAEGLNRNSEARRDWTELLQVETDDGWRDEAERHLQRLSNR